VTPAVLRQAAAEMRRIEDEAWCLSVASLLEGAAGSWEWMAKQGMVRPGDYDHELSVALEYLAAQPTQVEIEQHEAARQP
jgi:hypothetical protein